MQTLTLRTVYALVFIGHGRRRIVHVNVTRHPTARWIWRQVVEATPWGARPRYLIRDHDGSNGKDFIQRAARIGMHVGTELQVTATLTARPADGGEASGAKGRIYRRLIVSSGNTLRSTI